MPDHVRLAVADCLAVGERRPAVGRPGQLVEARRSLHALHPKSLPEAFASLEIGNELLDGGNEVELLCRRERGEVLDKPRQTLVGGQRLALLVVNFSTERAQEGLAGLMTLAGAE